MMSDEMVTVCDGTIECDAQSESELAVSGDTETAVAEWTRRVLFKWPPGIDIDAGGFIGAVAELESFTREGGCIILTMTPALATDEVACLPPTPKRRRRIPSIDSAATNTNTPGKTEQKDEGKKRDKRASQRQARKEWAPGGSEYAKLVATNPLGEPDHGEAGDEDEDEGEDEDEDEDEGEAEGEGEAGDEAECEAEGEAECEAEGEAEDEAEHGWSALADVVPAAEATIGDEWLASVASGGLHFTAVLDAPLSVRKALQFGDGALILGCTNAMWDAAGATSSKQRKALGMLLTALLHGIEGVSPPNSALLLYEPGTNHRCVWRILSAEAHAIVKKKATLATASELVAGARKRSKDDHVDKDVLRALAEAGKTRCDVCSMPLLDPDDPEFDRKANESEQLTRSDCHCDGGCGCSN